MVPLLIEKMDSGHKGSNHFLLELNEAVEFLEKLSLEINCQHITPRQRHQHTQALCATAAAHLFPAFVLYRLNAGAIHFFPDIRFFPDRTRALQFYPDSTRALQNALIAAAHVKDASKIAVLLAKGAEINHESEHFGTPLEVAARQGCNSTTAFLLERGADIENVKGRAYPGEWQHMVRYTALQAAASNGHEQTVWLLLDPKYNLVTSGIEYETAILNAGQSGYAKIVQLLLEKGHIISKARLLYTLLWKASERGRDSVVRQVLEYGVDANRRDTMDHTPLQKAAASGHENVVRTLLAAGARASYSGIPKPRFGSALFQAASNGHLSVVRVLLDNGAEINAEKPRVSPLRVAVDHGHVEIVRLLLERRADIRAAGVDVTKYMLDNTSLETAVLKKATDVRPSCRGCSIKCSLCRP